MRPLLLCAALLACQSQARVCASRPDVVDPCGGLDGGVGALQGTPDPGAVPSGTVGSTGGNVERLWFATTGDTRPAECDQTDAYPKAAIAQIAAAMKALRVQFTLDLGDHMYVCNQSDPEARQQMGFYMDAIAQGPSAWWMTMGNHECGNGTYPYACFVNGAHDANFAAYMAALNRPLPYYANDVQTSLGMARFVVIADDSWNPTQAAWLEGTLADADARAKYTIVARHHPVQGTRTGQPEILSVLRRHKYSLILTAHNHEYQHDTATWQGRSAVVGLGGAGGKWGFGTVLQGSDGSLVFVQRDANGNPIGAPWTVAPQ
jgi:calcineurin-like phosphoesterase family protein